MEKKSDGNRNILVEYLPLAAILLTTAYTTTYSYLLFHTIAETLSIVVGVCFFMIAWNSRRFLNNHYFLLVGIGYVFIVAIDFLHMLAYKGMNLFVGYDADLPTQLWIVARYLQAVTLLIAPFFINRKVNEYRVVAVYGIVTTALIWLIFQQVFPACYVEGVGLTSFKIISEYVICAIFLGGLVMLYINRNVFDEEVFRLLVLSIFIAMLAELAFTLYIGVYDLASMVGHLLRIISVYLVYKALVEIALTRQYSVIMSLRKALNGYLEKKKGAE